jgi:MoxR-like ATPase
MSLGRRHTVAHTNPFTSVDSEIRSVAGFEQSFGTLLSNVASVVVAPEHTVRLALLGFFAQGHVLVEDRPGVGKALLAKTIAESIEGDFTRVQFTPDLLPSDITGASIYNSTDHTFEFVPGPVFTNVLLADELNRTNPRTQAALLEAMAEGQVTADGVTRKLPEPFMVIATQNTLDSSGTFPLPDTELDRFLVRVGV